MKKDRDKWDARYLTRGVSFPDPDPFLVANRGLLAGGSALDLASGLGANALFLARCGYRVEAIDISYRALAGLKAKADRLRLDVSAVVADLDHYPIARNRYDLVTVFHFFSPLLMPAIQDSLKQDGILIYSTYNFRHRSVKPGFDPRYLVSPDGLAGYFPDLHVMVHQTEAGEAGNLSRLIATKR